MRDAKGQVERILSAFETPQADTAVYAEIQAALRATQSRLQAWREWAYAFVAWERSAAPTEDEVLRYSAACDRLSELLESLPARCELDDDEAAKAAEGTE
jgi:hypothetical protein